MAFVRCNDAFLPADVVFKFTLTCRSPALSGNYYSDYQLFLYQTISEHREKGMTFDDIARSEKRLQKFGLQPPIIAEDTYQYTDYYIYAMEYRPHKLIGFTVGSPPDWLIWHEPLMHKVSLADISNLPAEEIKYSPDRPTFDLNHGVKIT